jgi:hypothetical protein
MGSGIRLQVHVTITSSSKQSNLDANFLLGAKTLKQFHGGIARNVWSFWPGRVKVTWPRTTFIHSLPAGSSNPPVLYSSYAIVYCFVRGNKYWISNNLTTGHQILDRCWRYHHAYHWIYKESATWRYLTTESAKIEVCLQITAYTRDNSSLPDNRNNYGFSDAHRVWLVGFVLHSHFCTKVSARPPE